MTTIDEQVCDLLGGDKSLREFEDKYNPMSFLAHLYALNIPKNYAKYLASFYEDNVYKPIIREHLKKNGY